MRTTLSLTLIACLIGSALPEAAGSDWSRARRLRPGTEVVVAAKGGPAAQGYLVQTDESGLTVLNVNDLALSGVERSILRDAASKHPEYLLAAQRGRGHMFRNAILIGPAGLFIAGRKIAELRDVVATVARPDVIAIEMRRTRTHGSAAEMVGGALLGFVLTAVSAAGGGTGPNYCTDHPHGCPVVVALGAIGGGAAGYLGGKQETVVEAVLIYRAP